MVLRRGGAGPAVCPRARRDRHVLLCGVTGALVFVEGQQPRWALAVPQSRGGQVFRERALGTSLSFCAPSRRGCAGARGASPCSGRKSRWLDRVCALRAGRDSRASGPVPV